MVVAVDLNPRLSKFFQYQIGRTEKRPIVEFDCMYNYVSLYIIKYTTQ